MEQIIIGFILLIIGFLFGVEYGEIRNIPARILKEKEILLAKDLYSAYKENSLWDLEWCNLLNGVRDEELNKPITFNDEPCIIHRDEKYYNNEPIYIPEQVTINTESGARVYPENAKIQGWNFNSNTESIADYQEGCSFDKLATEDKLTWQDEMRRDLKMYCPDIFSEFIIRRIEEIKNGD